MRIFGQETIKKFVQVNATTLTWNSGSRVHFGAEAFDLLAPIGLDTGIIGVGGLESAIVSHQFYYVYSVLDAGVVKLIATTSEQKPSNYELYRKIGAFQLNGNNDIQDAYFFGSSIDVVEKGYFPTYSNPGMINSDNYLYSRFSSKIQIIGRTAFNAGGAASPLTISLPSGLEIDDTVKVISSSNNIFGQSHWLESGVNFKDLRVAAIDSVNTFGFYGENAASLLNENAFSVNDQIGLNITIPIRGWNTSIDWNLY